MCDNCVDPADALLMLDYLGAVSIRRTSASTSADIGDHQQIIQIVDHNDDQLGSAVCTAREMSGFNLLSWAILDAFRTRFGGNLNFSDPGWAPVARLRGKYLGLPPNTYGGGDE